MRLLFDQNLSFKLCARLADIFPESTQTRLVGLAQAQDRDVWDFALTNRLSLVSHDADFAELAALHGPPPKVIWLRCGNQSTAFTEALLRRDADVIRSFVADSDAACLELY